MGVVLEVFQKVLVAIEANMFHDAVRCPDFHVCSDWEFCKHSCFHPQHDLHVCPESQVCFCLCQGCSLRLTSTRGLVVEGGVKGVLDAFGS